VEVAVLIPLAVAKLKSGLSGPVACCFNIRAGPDRKGRRDQLGPAGGGIIDIAGSRNCSRCLTPATEPGCAD
jgi:hypothetical protein